MEKLATNRIKYKKNENLRMFLSKKATYNIARERAELSQNRKNTLSKNFPVSNWGMPP
jgi:hypothetical protein